MKRIVSSMEEYNRITQDWQDQLNRYNQEMSDYEDQVKKYRIAQKQIHNEAVAKFTSDLCNAVTSSYTENLRVRIDSGYISLLKVHIDYAENDLHGGHALNWNYGIDVEVNEDGTSDVKKESGSWSGLNATTSENIQELEQSIKMLKFIQSRSDQYWLDLVANCDVDYEDYVTMDRPKKPTSSELASKQIDALAGTGKWIVGQRKGQYLEVTKATNSMFFYDEYMALRDKSVYYGYTRRMNKEKFIETMVKLPITLTSKEEVEKQIENK